MLVLPAIAIGALVLLTASPQEIDGPRQRWFFDLNDGRLFAAPMTAVAPIPAPSGDLRGHRPGTPAGVEAIVVRPGDGGAPRVAYLASTCRPGNDAPTEIHPPRSGDRWVAVRLVRHPHGGDWVPEDSQAGQAITAQARAIAGSTPLALDFPAGH